jgi:hypothetical protein
MTSKGQNDCFVRMDPSSERTLSEIHNISCRLTTWVAAMVRYGTVPVPVPVEAKNFVVMWVGVEMKCISSGTIA